MQRNYLAKRIKPTFNPRDMDQAIEEFKNGKSLSIVTEKYFLSTITLNRHLKTGNQLKKRRGQTSSNREEAFILVYRIKTCGDWVFHFY